MSRSEAPSFDSDTIEIGDLGEHRLFSEVDRPTEKEGLSDLQRNYCLNQWDRSELKYVELANHVTPGWSLSWLNLYSGYVIEVTTVQHSTTGSREYLVRLTSLEILKDHEDPSKLDAEETTIIWQKRQAICLDERIEELLLSFARNILVE